MEEKAAIVMEVLTTSTPMAEICRKYNVHPTMVYKWKQSFVQGGTKAMPDKDSAGREKQLKLENRKLK
jgi:transposase-like protein